MPRVTLLYAGLLGLAFFWLSWRVIRARGQAGVSLGTGEDAALQRAARVHGNFAEYVPVVLVLMLADELAGAPVPLLHGAGIALVLGRLCHAVSIGGERHRMRPRVAGMVLTFLALIVLAIAAIILAFS
ncbi:MAPEG family protein [Pararoseomonas indoligenes]|uniref:MAPEG family protein n=1 Tax=Roseomonas indoligenes TaxID=2820811 RepID=A0A940MZ37_9PROT|nr:MAPEG family protein [Pararoseomonas indoligenes]MBP0494273.1 MAPEG family protein [Pararoseomonas indoligenes]